MGSTTECDTLQCAHCGAHWQVIRFSGRQRGFCTNCMGPLCGKKVCLQNCDPMEKQLDDVAKGKRVVTKQGIVPIEQVIASAEASPRIIVP